MTHNRSIGSCIAGEASQCGLIDGWRGEAVQNHRAPLWPAEESYSFLPRKGREDGRGAAAGRRGEESRDKTSGYALTVDNRAKNKDFV